MAKSKKQWWETLFDEKYLKTYVDTVTPKLTKQQIPFLLKRLQLKKGAEILDLACGHGRHAIELVKRGYRVTGLDFSKHFIDIAQKDAKKQGVKVNFIRGDMRNLSFVRIFSPAELGNMMKRNGLRVEKIWGDLRGSPLGIDSRRLVVLARKS